ncbi:bacterial low temperature requirement A protein-domain-containing protein [Dactylonectria estremocensis]|uniref:Bacterial low temperature requirement A protein-domain-containing protein n=1 Tax=Dactylonectria estremocensis TaxID=1079267 RepID=A0A9P9JEA0_9HYPO|nr:bacterial low temperature requirement A protein-domain-containing protein [Dactylonectria estremocensis]
MTGSNHESHAGDSGSTTPKGYMLRSSRTTFRFASSKLNLIKNPLKRKPKGEEGESLIDEHGQQHNESNQPQPGEFDNSPLQFAKLFYDLWFVANLNVFATVHPIVDTKNLISFVTYFLLLWVTWFITTVFDARFGQDGILERMARACHLAVMIGFAVAGVSFDGDEIVQTIFKATSLCLMASRLVLAAQYATVLVHARHHRRSRNAITFAITLHLGPAIAYLIVALMSTVMPQKQLFTAWYVIAVIEMVALMVHATFTKTLSFEGTHLNERLNLLTLIILGEGVIILAKNITKIVEYTYLKDASASWSSAQFGIITCAAGIIYMIFQLYFDWMHHHSHMGAINQTCWTLLHVPFHIALVLLAEGSSQWVLWWRAIESFRGAESNLHKNAMEATELESSSKVMHALNKTAQEILYRYGSDIAKGGDSARPLNETLTTLLAIPDSFWNQDDLEDMEDTDSKYYQIWIQAYSKISNTVVHAISEAFGLSVENDYDRSAESESNTLANVELEAVRATASRLVLIFIYVFLSAGLVLILLMLMHLLSKRRGWTLFNRFRVAVVFAIGIGLGLVALVGTNAEYTANFLLTPWQLPTIAICYFVVLILTHLPHPPRIFLKRSEVDEMEMGAVPEQEPPTEAQPDVAQSGTRQCVDMQYTRTVWPSQMNTVFICPVLYI